VLRKFQALAGEAVEVRRGGVATVEGDIGPAEIVGQDENDIGGGRGRGGATGGGRHQEETGEPENKFA
jgi:hypothetical protein